VPTPALPSSKGGGVTAPLFKVLIRSRGNSFVALDCRRIATQQEALEETRHGIDNAPVLHPLTFRARFDWSQPAVWPVSVITEQVRPERGLNNEVHDGVATTLFFLRARKLAMKEVMEVICTQAFHPGVDKAPEGSCLQEGRGIMFSFEEQTS